MVDQVTDINVCCIIAHRSPPVDQRNSASTIRTDQPAVGTKRAWMPGSKIILPSSDAEQYTGNVLLNTVSSIAKRKGMILFSYKL